MNIEFNLTQQTIWNRK